MQTIGRGTAYEPNTQTANLYVYINRHIWLDTSSGGSGGNDAIRKEENIKPLLVNLSALKLAIIIIWLRILCVLLLFV